MGGVRPDGHFAVYHLTPQSVVCWPAGLSTEWSFNVQSTPYAVYGHLERRRSAEDVSKRASQGSRRADNFVDPRNEPTWLNAA
jgi:hypothetical protein